MDIAEFARKYRLKVRRDECGDLVIAGTAGVISENASGRLIVLTLFESRRKWNTIRKKLVKAGFVIAQCGDTEGTAIFDPTDTKQAKLAITVAGIRKPRVLSVKQRTVLRKRMAEVRSAKKVA